MTKKKYSSLHISITQKGIEEQFSAMMNAFSGKRKRATKQSKGKNKAWLTRYNRRAKKADREMIKRQTSKDLL